MQFPSPADPAQAPVWENYVVAQGAQAALGLIPRSAGAFGLRVSGAAVELVFHLDQLTETDAADMQDIAEELEHLLGPDVRVTHRHKVLATRAVSPYDGARWIYLRRQTHET